MGFRSFDFFLFFFFILLFLFVHCVDCTYATDDEATLVFIPIFCYLCSFFFLADLNVFHSDANRTYPGAQSSGIQSTPVQAFGDADDYHKIGTTQNTTVPVHWFVASGQPKKQQ